MFCWWCKISFCAISILFYSLSLSSEGFFFFVFWFQSGPPMMWVFLTCDIVHDVLNICTTILWIYNISWDWYMDLHSSLCILYMKISLLSVVFGWACSTILDDAGTIVGLLLKKTLYFVLGLSSVYIFISICKCWDLNKFSISTKQKFGYLSTFGRWLKAGNNSYLEFCCEIFSK